MGLAEYVLPVGGLPYIAAALALLCLPARRLKDRGRTALCLLSAAAGLFLWWGEWTVKVAPVMEMVGQKVTVEARVTDYVERHDDYERVEVRVLSGAPAGKGLLYYYDGSLPELEPGDVIRAEVRLTDPMVRQGTRSRLYTSQGRFILGYIQPDTLAVTGRTPGAGALYFPKRLCRAVKELCQRLFPADAAPLVTGLLTGDTQALEEDLDAYAAMRVAGVMHIVAVSGMHLFVLTGFLQLLLGRSRRTSLICLPAVALFTLMTGCRPSVVRAAVMQALYLAAPLAHRETDGASGLGAAAVLLLAVNPMAIGGVGLQLSFACMAGVVFLQPALMQWLHGHAPMDRRLVRAAGTNLVCTVSATAFSTPLAAYYFGLVPLWSPAANLLTLPVVEAVFAGSYVCCALGALWPAAGLALGRLLAWPVRWCRLVYRTLAGFPVAYLSMDAPGSALWLAGLYALFALWAVRRIRAGRDRTRRPRRGRERRIGADVPVCLAVLGLCGVLTAAKLSVPADGGLVAVLDVGQGECVVLAGHEGTVAVDCGGSGLENAGDTAANYLQSIGRTSLDALVLTHLHADHADGVTTLLARLPVGEIILPASADDADGLLAEILDAAARWDVPVLFLEEEARFSVGDVALELYLPGGGDANERGIVVRAALAGHEALIMGDAGKEAELALLRQGALGHADVLVAGHHGSKGASGELMLLAVRPDTAVVSVGYNTYGQPAEEALARLEAYAGAVRRTDLEGSVTLRLQADGGEHGQTG